MVVVALPRIEWGFKGSWVLLRVMSEYVFDILAALAAWPELQIQIQSSQYAE